MLYGGFELSTPNVPTDSIYKIHLNKLFDGNSNLLTKLANFDLNSSASSNTSSNSNISINTTNNLNSSNISSNSTKSNNSTNEIRTPNTPNLRGNNQEGLRQPPREVYPSTNNNRIEMEDTINKPHS